MATNAPVHPSDRTAADAHGEGHHAGRRLLLSLALCSLLVVPVIQWVGRPIAISPIHGIAIPPPPNPPSLGRILSGRFQREVEQFASRGTGLWPALVRGANQLTLSVFNQIGTSRNSSVLVGSNTTFFQPMYLRSFNRSRGVDKKVARAAAKGLQKLQKQLEKRGISLVLLISPNAIALYPEIVPPSLTDPTRLQRPNSYEVALPVMQKSGVPMVDMFAFFNESRDQFPGRIFSRTGSHWNDLASCIAAQATMNKLNTVMPSLAGSWASISCDNHSWNAPPPREDTDLLEIANVLLPERYLEPGVTVTHSQPAVSPSRKVLLVGTSFLFAIQSHLERAAVVEEAGLYFYAKSFRRSSKEQLRPLPLTRVNWDDIWKYNAIILEINQASLTGAGHGFVSAALKALKGS